MIMAREGFDTRIMTRGAVDLAVDSLRQYPSERMLLERILELLCMFVYGKDRGKQLIKEYMPSRAKSFRACSHKRCPDDHCRVEKARRRFKRVTSGG